MKDICSEPDGNRHSIRDDPLSRTGHEIALVYDGRCPWCGKEAEEDE